MTTCRRPDEATGPDGVSEQETRVKKMGDGQRTRHDGGTGRDEKKVAMLRRREEEESEDRERSAQSISLGHSASHLPLSHYGTRQSSRPA